MSEAREIELIFEPLEEGGYHVYAPDLPGLHTQGDDIDDASLNAEEALALYVEGLREDGGHWFESIHASELTRVPRSPRRMAAASPRAPMPATAPVASAKRHAASTLGPIEPA